MLPNDLHGYADPAVPRRDFTHAGSSASRYIVLRRRLRATSGSFMSLCMSCFACLSACLSALLVCLACLPCLNALHACLQLRICIDPSDDSLVPRRLHDVRSEKCGACMIVCMYMHD